MFLSEIKFSRQADHTRVIVVMTLLGMISLLSLFTPKVTKGEQASITQLETLEQKEQKLKELEEKAVKYKKMIQIKQSQQKTLNDQISLMETEIDQLGAEIEVKKREAADFSNQIEKLGTRIHEQQNSIKSQKKILSTLAQLYYENKKNSYLNFFMNSDSAFALTGNEDKVAQAGMKLNETMSNIESMKDALEQERDDIESKKKIVTDLYYELEDKNSQLETSKVQKEVLINQTKGDEKKYQELLTRVEEQKEELLGDLDEKYSANSLAVEELAASLPKPTSGLASTSWYYSQKDSRWGNSRIGQSKSLMKDYGCAISSVAMVFTYHGHPITPGALAKKPIFYWDLISWPEEWEDIELVTNTGHGGLSWSAVDSELKKGKPVIVFVSARGKAGHYVVIHHKDSSGKYIVHDPYFGPNIYLDSTIKLLGKLYGTTVTIKSVDQMVAYN